MRTAAVAVGVGVVALVATLVILNLVEDDPDVVAPVTEAASNEPGDVRAFLAAWERFRTGTFVAESVLTRTFDDGRNVDYGRRLVQDPPIRISGQGGSAIAEGGETDLLCTTNVADVFVCGESEGDTPITDADYEAAVDDEQATLANYFAGEPPPYLLSAGDDGCFELVQAQAQTLPSFGSRATVCFDAATGVLARQRVRREGAVDDLTLVNVRSEVTADDLVVTG